MTPGHLFRIASHSKTFTATSIMQLAEKGKLQISDPISKYLTFLKDNPDKRIHEVTIQEILSHSAGMWRDGDEASFWRLERPFPTKEEIREFYRTKPLVIENNTRFKYSNYGYALLGYLIEEVTGLVYTEYVQENILKLLGLDSKKIGGDYNENASPYITGYTGYTPNKELVPLSAKIPTNQLAGATGFYANAESLCHFYTAIMLKSGKLLSDKSKKEMLRLQWQAVGDPTETGYGLGFRYAKSGERILRGHAGGMPGNSTRTYFDQEDGLVVSVLSNSHEGKPLRMINGIFHIIDFYKKNFKDPSKFKKLQCCLYDVWGISAYVPVGEKIYVCSFSAPKIFDDCQELEYKKDNTFKIIKDDGYGGYGQDVERDKVKGVKHAGFPMLDKQGYLEYLEELKNRI